MKMNREKNFISAVVYIHNHKNYIFEFLCNVYETLKNNFENFEVICVNDGSTEDIASEIKRASENYAGNRGGYN